MRGRITHRVSNHRNILIFDELYFLQVAFPCNIDFLIFHFDSNFLHCIQMKLIVIFGWSSYLSSFNVILIDTLLL